jgi:Rrf2 family transcriptional regulator, nitric oxide-sensitive transcriptional repressor
MGPAQKWISSSGLFQLYRRLNRTSTSTFVGEGARVFSQTVEYALRAIVFLADKSPDACTTEQIAEATQVPKPYLSKVLQNLGRHNIVHSQRGIGGGVTLVKLPRELTILEVVNAVEPIQRITTCPLGLKSHGKNLCPLHRRMDDALASVEAAFANTTLAEVLAEPTGSPPLCEGRKPERKHPVKG